MTFPADVLSELAPTASEITEHHAEVVHLTSSYGPMAALRSVPAGPQRGTVVMLHGFTGSKEDFGALLRPLAAAGLSCIAVDLPGSFESPHSSEAAADFWPESLARPVSEMIARLPGSGPVHLLGHSFGGLVAQCAMVLRAPVTSLTLLCSGPGALTNEARRDAIAHGEQVLLTDGLERAWQFHARSSPPYPGPDDAATELTEFLHRRFVSNSIPALLGMGRALLEQPDLRQQCGAVVDKLRLPVAVVRGAGDDAWDPALQESMAARYRAQMQTISAAEHSPNHENPRELLRALGEFWLSLR